MWNYFYTERRYFISMLSRLLKPPVSQSKCNANRYLAAVLMNHRKSQKEQTYILYIQVNVNKPRANCTGGFIGFSLAWDARSNFPTLLPRELESSTQKILEIFCFDNACCVFTEVKNNNYSPPWKRKERQNEKNKRIYLNRKSRRKLPHSRLHSNLHSWKRRKNRGIRRWWLRNRTHRTARNAQNKLHAPNQLSLNIYKALNLHGWGLW